MMMSSSRQARVLTCGHEMPWTRWLFPHSADLNVPVMVTCPQCDVEQPEPSRFCSACGAALSPEHLATVAHNGSIASPGSSYHSSPFDSSQHGRFLPGTKVASRYRIVSLVGKGGMGEVYRADDLKLGHTVALKFLPKDLAEYPRRLEYLHSEVRLSRQISHPNVCRVYDIGEIDGQHFLSMVFSSWFCYAMLYSSPMTSEFSAWYASPGKLTLLIIASLAIYSFCTSSLGVRPVEAAARA